jgi:signal transduction histidine kinase
VIIVATTTIVLVLVTLAFVANEAITSRLSIRQELTALANVIGRNATAAITFGDQKSAAATLASLSAKPHVASAALVLPDGTIFAYYEAPGETANTLRLLLSGSGHPAGDTRKALADYLQRSEETWNWDGNERVIVPLLLEGKEIGKIIVNSSLCELYDRLKGFLVLMMLITYVAIGIAYWLAIRLQRPILEPILQLVDATRAVSRQRDYTIRARKQSNDEIGQLVDGFNEMLTQIQKRDADLERYAAELQDGNEELKSFIYSAAHDLRAPLVNVRGFTAELGRAMRELQDLTAKHEDSIPEEIRRRIDAIVQDDVVSAMEFIDSSADRMSGLINALLKLSQLGYRDLRPEPLDMKELVKASLHAMKHHMDRKSIAVEVGELPPATADRIAMEQIIMNLLDNAMKYLSPERPGSIVIGSRESEDGTVFFVQDNGRGIREDDLPKLFKIFRRLGSPDIPGEGIGLAYVKTLVKRHGGRIWCESEPGKGSVFSFLIPTRHELEARRT